MQDNPKPCSWKKRARILGKPFKPVIELSSKKRESVDKGCGVTRSHFLKKRKLIDSKNSFLSVGEEKVRKLSLKRSAEVVN